MQISERLKVVAEAVKLRGVVADIGCDHAFTSIYMIKNGIANRVIATDIGKSPLGRAEEHILDYGLADKIETRLSDGLGKLEPGEADSIIISGMGGALMSGILQRGKAVLDKTGELVLSPQSEIFLIRRFLNENNFLIDKEYMIFEEKKYYVVIHAVPGNEPLFDTVEELYGRVLLREKNPVLKRFLVSERSRLEGVLGKISGDGLSETAQKRKLQLQEEKKMVEGVLGNW